MLPRLTALVGLVLAASPVLSQDYIDLEAERAQAESQAQTNAVSVPDAGAAAEAQDPSPPQAAVDRPAPAVNQNVGELLYQVQLLQQEVMTLRGLVEEQGHQLRQLKQQSLDRYLDLDQRISAGAGAGAVAAGSDPVKTSPPATAAGSGQPAAELPGEGDAYKAAFALVRGKQFDEAIVAFDAFLQNYPDGRYAANAHYWLGELYLVITPQDLESSRQAFTLLLREYPNTSKAPDALYKLGKVYFQKGNSARAREYFERVVAEFGDSDSSSVKLAQDFLAENF